MTVHIGIVIVLLIVVAVVAYWLGSQSGGASGVRMQAFQIQPGNGSGSVYECATQTINGTIVGTSPWPYRIYGYAFGSGAEPTYPDGGSHSGDVRSIPWLEPPHGSGTGAGEFSIDGSGTAWPTDGSGTVVIWASVMHKSVSEDFSCGSGSGSGSGEGVTGGGGGSASRVHDMMARQYRVEVDGFGPDEDSNPLRGVWSVSHRATSIEQGLNWRNAPDADGPSIELLVDPLARDGVVCRLVHGSTRLEYAIETSGWKPLSENRLDIVCREGLGATATVPGTITVRPA